MPESINSSGPARRAHIPILYVINACVSKSNMRARSLSPSKPQSSSTIFVDTITIDIESHPLCRAVCLGSSRLVRTLLEGGIDVNSCNIDGQSALIALCIRLSSGADTLELATILLKSGADPNHQDRYGKSALMYACALDRDVALIELLLRYGADLLLCDNIGFTALIYAYNRRNPDVIRLVRDQCAHPRTIVTIETRLDSTFMSTLKIQRLFGSTNNNRSLSDVSNTKLSAPTASHRASASNLLAIVEDSLLAKLRPSRSSNNLCVDHNGANRIMPPCAVCRQRSSTIMIDSSVQCGIINGPN